MRCGRLYITVCTEVVKLRARSRVESGVRTHRKPNFSKNFLFTCRFFIGIPMSSVQLQYSRIISTIHSIETFMPPRTMHSHTCTALLIRGEARCLSKRASQGSCALCGELSALAHLDESLPLFGISLLVTSHVAGWSITWPSCHLPLALRLACTPRLPIPSGFSGRGP